MAVSGVEHSRRRGMWAAIERALKAAAPEKMWHYWSVAAGLAVKLRLIPEGPTAQKIENILNPQTDLGPRPK